MVESQNMFLIIRRNSSYILTRSPSLFRVETSNQILVLYFYPISLASNQIIMHHKVIVLHFYQIS